LIAIWWPAGDGGTELAMAFLVELSAVRVRGWMCGGGRVQGGHGVASGGRAMRGQGERRWRHTWRAFSCGADCFTLYHN